MFGEFTFFKTLTETIWDWWVGDVKKSCRWMVNEVPGRVRCPSTCWLLGQSDLFLADLWLFQLSMHWFCSETFSPKHHPWEFIYKESWLYKNGYWDLQALCYSMLDIPITYLGLRDVYSLHLHPIPTGKNRTLLGEPIWESPKMTSEPCKKPKMSWSSYLTKIYCQMMIIMFLTIL